MILTSCQLKKSKLCEKHNTVNVNGWRNDVDETAKNSKLTNVLHLIIAAMSSTYFSFRYLGKMHFLSSIENTTSFFTYEWIDYRSVINITGICLTFQYRINGENNSLALYFRSLSLDKTLVWRLRGNHGNTWKNGAITYRPSEDLSVMYLVVYLSFVCLFDSSIPYLFFFYFC